MGDALGVLGLMAFLGVSFVAVWVISGAAERYFRRRRRESGVELVPAGSIWDDLKSAVLAICTGIGTLVVGLAGCLGRLIGCLLLLVLGLVGLFFVVWLIKQMWEAA
jgi:uncharacterized membrane protein